MENSNLPLHLIENKRFGYLDLARGVAALGILLFHTYSSKPVFSTLYTFVDFFFVLSGFVLANSISSANSLKDLKRFLIKRVIRLFPMAGTTIVFTLLIQFIVDLKRFVLDQPVAPRIETDILTLILAITLLQIFSNSAIMLNAPLWSLSAEWIITLAGGEDWTWSIHPFCFARCWNSSDYHRLSVWICYRRYAWQSSFWFLLWSNSTPLWLYTF